MALLLSKDTPYGDSLKATYWNIGGYAQDFRSGSGSIMVFGYISETERRAGKSPIAQGVVAISAEDFKPDMTRSDLYGLIKKAQVTVRPGVNENWSAAEDA